MHQGNVVSVAACWLVSTGKAEEQLRARQDAGTGEEEGLNSRQEKRVSSEGRVELQQLPSSAVRVEQQ